MKKCLWSDFLNQGKKSFDKIRAISWKTEKIGYKKNSEKRGKDCMCLLSKKRALFVTFSKIKYQSIIMTDRGKQDEKRGRYKFWGYG